MNLVKKKICWIVSDNIIGHQNQSVSLADSLKLKYKIKKIKRLNFFQRNFLILFPSLLLDKNIKPPYPNIVISCGKNTAYIANFLKKKIKKKIISIFIQKPPINIKNFDLVVAPKHDQCYGKNVIETNGALNRINKKFIKKVQMKRKASALSKDFIAVLIGGDSKHHSFTKKILEEIKNKLLVISKKYNYKILIFFSRRTKSNHEFYLKKNLKNNFTFISSTSEKIKYFEAISYAKAIIVSSDSISMVSEACSTGKSSYLINIPTKSKKFSVFIKNLIDLNLISYLKDSISLKNKKNALNDTEIVAKKIIKKFDFFRNEKL